MSKLPESQRRKKALTVMLTEPTRERLEKASVDLQRTKSWIGLQAIDEFLDRHDAQGKKARK